MRSSPLRSLVTALLLTAAGASFAKAQVALMRNAPFEADQTRTSVHDGASTTATNHLARASAGSTYREIHDSSTGELAFISIVDVPGQREIFLDVVRRTYSLRPTTLPALPEARRAKALDSYLEKLKSAPAGSPAPGTGDGSAATSLGFRTENGFEEYGRRIVYEPSPDASRPADTWEEWSVPTLSLVVEQTGFDGAGKPVQKTRLTNIKAQEPPARLFEIPEGYKPLTGPPPPQ